MMNELPNLEQAVKGFENSEPIEKYFKVQQLLEGLHKDYPNTYREFHDTYLGGYDAEMCDKLYVIIISLLFDMRKMVTSEMEKLEGQD